LSMTRSSRVSVTRYVARLGIKPPCLSFGDIIPQISDRRKIKLYIVLGIIIPLQKHINDDNSDIVFVSLKDSF
jgi:hypothetical protein